MILGGATALYAAGIGAMMLTPPPWGWLWTIPLALTAGGVCRLMERPAERRALRRHSGRCERCAYDLRATPQRCPECGRATW